MNLCVGNLSPEVGTADLQHIFSGLGEVLFAKLTSVSDGRTDRGYAYVYVPNDERARTVIAMLNGKLLKGDKLTVSPMVERPGVIGNSVKRN